MAVQVSIGTGRATLPTRPAMRRLRRSGCENPTYFQILDIPISLRVRKCKTVMITDRGLSIVGRIMKGRREVLRSAAPYSSKIIKAGALIGDTKTLLSHWDVTAPVAENIKRVQRDNIFGKASRSRVEDILVIFRQRYLTEESVTRALATLVRRRFPTASLARLLYFHSARADRLLHDVVTEIIGPMQARGLVDIEIQNFQRSLAKWVNEGKTTGHWSEDTITRISQGLVSALRAFGVLEGAVY